MNEFSIPLYAGGPPQSDQIFLQNLGASQEYVDQMRWKAEGEGAPATWLERTLRKHDIIGDQDSPLIPADEARERLKHESVTFDIPDAGIRQSTYDSMLERQYNKRAAEDARIRGPQGLGAELRGLAIGLARQAIDPINIAAAFIPIVGEVRMAEMLAAAGTSWTARAGVFAKVGAIEGTVGTAMLEPAMHYMAGQLQEDYTMADSLLNIAFGGVIGGGLHVGVGSIKEWYVGRGVALAPGEAPNHLLVPAQGEIPERIAALDRDTRIEIGKAALAQAIDGREIDIAPMLDLAGIEASVNAQERKPGFLKSAEELFAQRQEERLRGTPGFLQSALDKLAIRELDEAQAEVNLRVQERIEGEVRNELGKVEDARQRELQQRLATQDPDLTAMQLADLMERQQARTDLLADPARLAEEAKARDLTINELREKLERMQAAGERDLKTYRDAALRQITSVSPDAIARLNEARKTAAERTQQLAKANQPPESGIPREALQVSEEAERLVKEESTPAEQPDSATARTMLQDAEHELKPLLKKEILIKKTRGGVSLIVKDIAEVESHFDDAIIQSVGSTDTKSVVAHLRQLMGIPENADIRITEKSTTTRLRGQDAYGVAKLHFNKQTGESRINLILTSKRPSVIAHELEHAKDMLRGDYNEDGFSRGHHDHERLIRELTEELGVKMDERAAMKEMFAEEDAAIKQAKDDQKILTALAQCHLRKG